MTQAQRLRICLIQANSELFDSHKEFEKANPFTPSFKFPDHSHSTIESGQENTSGVTGLVGVRKELNNKIYMRGCVMERKDNGQVQKGKTQVHIKSKEEDVIE